MRRVRSYHLAEVLGKLPEGDHKAIRELVDEWLENDEMVESFKTRYGDDWKSVMFGTATNMIKKRKEKRARYIADMREMKEIIERGRSNA